MLAHLPAARHSAEFIELEAVEHFPASQ